MAGDQDHIFPGRTPVVHEHIMQRLQLIIRRRAVGINFQEALQRSPDIAHKPLAECIAIALFISLVAVRAENIQLQVRRNRYPHQDAGEYPDRRTINFFEPARRQGIIIPKKIMIPEQFTIGIPLYKFFFCCKYRLVMLYDAENSALPEFLTVSQVDIIELLPVVIVQRSEVTLFTNPEIVRTVSGAAVLIAENDYFNIFFGKRKMLGSFILGLCRLTIQ